MSDTSSQGYQVLARKYRPETFADLVGQDAMVRTLKNAFDADRIAQAFIMTGIRGTGKTTTARIIAKGMNCIGLDGNGVATTDPCGLCDNCTAIMQGRHVDVMEMDAASRTGVDDIREIIESVHYRAAAARYKIYIIDEVHMLSTNAFNALLKTLEEPPEHVKFIFATTEIRKVPVTVLSRCQRFDLRRIEPEVMIALLQKIAASEQAKIAEDALALITRAAEGSARDATSLLDQSISHGAGETTADQVRAMLGLADRGRVMDLFDMIMRGNASSALDELGAQYSDGADPLAVLRDLAEITHWISVVKITPNAADDPTISPDDRIRGQGFAQALPMRALTRAWQMLLKALEEVASAPNSMTAAEMAIIRLTHVADLPTPDELVKKLQDLPPPSGRSSGRSASQMGGRSSPLSQTQATAYMQSTPAKVSSGPNTSGSKTFGSNALGAGTALALADEQALFLFPTFDHVVNIIRDHRDIRLLVDVETCIQLVEYRPGRIEFEPTETAPSDLAQRLGSKLQAWTGARWTISLVSTGGKPTIDAERQIKEASLKEAAAAHPIVQAVFSAFPNAKISDVKTLEAMAAQAQVDALPEVDDEWDPFEED